MSKLSLLSFRAKTGKQNKITCFYAVELITNIAPYDPKYYQKYKLELSHVSEKISFPMPVPKLKHMLGTYLSHFYCKNVLFSQELNISWKPFLVPNQAYQVYVNDIHFKI